MSKEVLIAKGSFSKLSITIPDDMLSNLAVIEQESNPLAKVERKLKTTLREFETAYFKATRPKL
jgi:hypothetical protein